MIPQGAEPSERLQSLSLEALLWSGRAWAEQFQGHVGFKMGLYKMADVGSKIGPRWLPNVFVGPFRADLGLILGYLGLSLALLGGSKRAS